MASPEGRGPGVPADTVAASPGGDIVVDTSAVLATLFAEPQRDAILVALAEARTVLISSCCLLEASIVASARLGEEGMAELRMLLDAFAVETVSFTPEQAVLASDAWQRFGKGRHPAALNILDCCSYALAQVTDRRLLAIGDDFTKTDAELVDLTLAPVT
ncbi:MAG TPA: type II toxin-antitoxin system VapC family toxin [Thermoleophilia bacterium]|nr:type II toxin-antitoxin system VapC family toxin [Thermoleophilia bacterium]HQJ98765.1 type II toxin-antitoxin system VapC family toxin [Thermoleophilia bacterium]